MIFDWNIELIIFKVYENFKTDSRLKLYCFNNSKSTLFLVKFWTKNSIKLKSRFWIKILSTVSNLTKKNLQHYFFDTIFAFEKFCHRT